MCPVLNSKPYWSNKQVVPLSDCCPDAMGSPGNRLVVCGDRTFFQLNFQVQSKKIYLEKKLHFCNTSWPKIRPFAKHCSCQVWACIAAILQATANRQIFLKIAKFYQKLTRILFELWVLLFLTSTSHRFLYWYVNIRAPSDQVRNQNTQRSHRN